MTNLNIVGVMIYRDDSWCTAYTVPAALRWCDSLIVVVDTRGSGDVSKHFLCHAGQVTIAPYTHPDADDFREGDMRQRGLDLARARGATHVGIVDADEALSGNALNDSERIRERIATLEPGEALAAPQLAPWDGFENARVDGDFANPHWTFAIAIDDKTTWVNSDNFQIHRRLPLGDWRKPVPLHGASVVHFQFASLLRVRAKALWYSLVENTRYAGRLSVREINDQYGWALRGAPRFVTIPERSLCFDYPSPPDKCIEAKHSIDLAAAPWQLSAARDLAIRYPRALRGLNTYGLESIVPEFSRCRR